MNKPHKIAPSRIMSPKPSNNKEREKLPPDKNNIQINPIMMPQTTPANAPIGVVRRTLAEFAISQPKAPKIAVLMYAVGSENIIRNNAQPRNLAKPSRGFGRILSVGKRKRRSTRSTAGIEASGATALALRKSANPYF